MTRPACLAGLSLLLATVALAGEYSWQPVPGAPVAGRHEDVHFLDAEVGWTVNNVGQVWSTSDGGETWSQHLQVTSYLRSLHVVSPSVVVVGSLIADSLLYRTTDGGDTWTDITASIPGTPPTGICGMSGFGDHVFGSGRFTGNPRLIVSDDQGASWMNLDLSPWADNLVDCRFFTPDSGFVVGGRLDGTGLRRPVILQTRDGGASWDVRWHGGEAGSYGWKLFVLDGSHLYCAVQADVSSGVLSSDDGGLTWSLTSIEGYRFMQSVGFASPDRGWVHGHQEYGYETVDGGMIWTEATIGELDSSINRFQMLSPTLGFAAGRTIYAYLPGAVDVAQTVSEGPRRLQLRASPNPFAPSTRLSFVVPVRSRVLVRIYTALGQHVRTLVDRPMPAGDASVVWDGRDANGEPVPSNPYFYRVDAGGTAEDGRITLVR